MLYRDNRPLAGPHYLNHLNYSWPSDCQVVSLISGQEYFTFLYEHTKYNQEGGRKEKKHGLGLAPNARKGEVCDTFMLLSVHLQAIASVYSSEIPTKSPGMLTHLLTLAIPACGSTHLSSRLLSPADCLVLTTSLFCLLLCSALGPSFPRPLPVSCEISCASPLCVFRAKTDKRILWLAPTPTHTETNATHRVTLYDKHIWIN